MSSFSRSRYASSFLLWTAYTGTLTSTIFCGLAVVAALRFARRKRSEADRVTAFAPPVSVLKPLHGAQPGLRKNIESHFRQNYAAPYELLFCARQESDAGLQIAREIAARYPEQIARFIACGEPRFPNPKMYSLSLMAEAAVHPHLVTTDADARVRDSFLASIVQPLAPDRGTSLVWCMYAGDVDRGGGLAAHLDAAGKTVEMASGVMVADMLSGTDFALGVAMALERSTYQRAGGYEDLGNYWAEDFVLGNRLAKGGGRVEISTHVIRLIVDNQGFARSFRDQLRWMQSTRRSRPWGHLGTGLTFAMPFGLLGFAVQAVRGRWKAAFLLLGAAVLNRMLQAAVLLRVLQSDRIAIYTLLYPARDLLGFAVWCCSYLPADTRYHGTRFRIMPDGKLQAEAEEDGSTPLSDS